MGALRSYYRDPCELDHALRDRVDGYLIGWVGDSYPDVKWGNADRVMYSGSRREAWDGQWYNKHEFQSWYGEDEGGLLWGASAIDPQVSKFAALLRELEQCNIPNV